MEKGHYDYRKLCYFDRPVKSQQYELIQNNNKTSTGKKVPCAISTDRTYNTLQVTSVLITDY